MPKLPLGPFGSLVGSSRAEAKKGQKERMDLHIYIYDHIYVYYALAREAFSTTLSDGRQLLKMQIVALRQLHNKT